MNPRLHIDLEFYSPLSIKEHPLDVYAAAPGSQILMASYALDDGPINRWEYDQGPRGELRDALTDPTVIKMAWNVGYERTVLRAKGIDIPIEQWDDVMVHARYAGLPGRLKECVKVPMLQVPPDQKTKNETLLITRFCLPDKKGRTTDELRKEYAEDWRLFGLYCDKDVFSMRWVWNWVKVRFPLPERERQLWILDQKINERGLPVDVELAKAAQRETARLVAEAQTALKELTGLENPNSVQQIHPWLQERGYKYDSLGKEFVRQALTETEGDCQAALQVRLDSAKNSVKKFGVIVEKSSPDFRLRNQFVFYGAHTGRWSARDVQPHNLTRKETDKETLEELLKLCPSRV